MSPLRFGRRAHKVGYGKVGKAMRQEKSHLHAVMVGGYLAEGATDFYTTAERRGTAMKRAYKIINTTLSAAKTLLRGAFIKKEDTKMCESVNV